MNRVTFLTNGTVYDFSVDHSSVKEGGIFNIHQYLMIKYLGLGLLKKIFNRMFRFIKKIFNRLLASVVSASSHMKCFLSSNQKCMTQPTIINLHPNEYTPRSKITLLSICC